MTSEKSFLFALFLSSAIHCRVSSGHIFLSRRKKLTSGGELVRADRAELFPRDNITCAHSTEINVVVYFTFHHRGRNPVQAGRSRRGNHFCKLSSSARKAAVWWQAWARRHDFAESIVLFTVPHERERRLEKWSSKSRWRGDNERLRIRGLPGTGGVDNFKFNVA